MSILDRAKAHFDAQETRVITVPEWTDEDGNPTIIYSSPLTLHERKQLGKFAENDDLEFIVRLVIMKSLTADGEKVFSIGDKPMLMNHCDPMVISRIAADITASISVEDQSGN